jgi:PIN domain nuclease of toxin-antitoxin system
LLDTHIWLWSHGRPERLKPRVARALRNPRNELWFSPISTWEIVLLTQRRLVRLDPDVETWFAESLECLPLREAPITHEIALEAPRVALPHQDPADRFLVATAKVLQLTLVTSDENILSAPGLPVLANR